ncbi:MAG: hypothetical protein ACOX9C_01530 [Kiritimatiellia bacterium]
MKKWISQSTTVRRASVKIGAFALGFVWAMSSAIAQVSWVGDATLDDAWETGANWSSGVAPTNTDDVVINAGSSVLNPVVISTAGQSAKTLKLGSAADGFGALLMAGGDFSAPGAFLIGDAGEGHLTVTNGLLATSGSISLGHASSGTGALFMEGGKMGCANKFYIGNSGTGTVVLAGGTLYTSGNFYDPILGNSAGSQGFLVVSNGTFSSGYAFYVGASGSGHLVQVGGDISMTRQFYVGSGSSGSGKVDFGGGTFKVARECHVGFSGHGELNVFEGADVTLGRCLRAGVNAGAVGVVRTDAVTIKGTEHYPYVVGDAGHGEMHPKGTTFGTNRAGLQVRLSESAHGLVNGWGKWHSIVAANYKVGVNINNGLIVANGFGEDRDLDFSAYVASVDASSTTNSIENTSTNGWYAVNGGRLVLGGIDLGAGSDVGASWGEAIGDTEIDLVNSARFEFGNIATAGRLVGKLLAADRTDVPSLPPTGTCVGVWDFSFTGAFDTVDVQLRYDDVASAGKLVVMKRWNDTAGFWESLPTTELPQARIQASGLAELGLFAAFAGDHPTLIIVR